MPTRRLRDLSPRKMPRQARSEATVNAIFEATIQVLLARGIRRLTTTRVAERAGVSVGTMYQYFPHKEALIRAIIERYLGHVAEVVEKCCADNIGQPLTVASDALVISYIAAKSQDVDVSRALYSASDELEVTDVVTAAFQRFNIAAARLFRSCPDVRCDDVGRVSFTIMASLTGATRVVFENGAAPDMLADFRARMLSMSRAFLADAATKR
jgi:AcrR family transcriptional regulator